MTVAIPARAERLIERLEQGAARYGEPRADPVQAERAIQEHLRRLGLDPCPVRFVSDLPSARKSVFDAVLDADAWIGPWRAAWREANHQAWLARAPWSTARRLAEVRARRAVAIRMWQWLQGFLPTDPFPGERGWGGFGWAAGQACCDVLDAVVEIVTWSSEPDISAPIDRWISILSPLLEAFEAGLWLFWVTHRDVLAFLRPAVRTENHQLHCDDGPAVVWPDGYSQYFWRGVRVSEKVVLRPLDLTAREIASEGNAEVRRVMLERYGPARFIQDTGARLVHSDETGELYRLELERDEALCMVRVLDATPQPDGSRRAYWLRVPPTVQTAREAVAWTFGLEAEDYRPATET